MQVSQTMFLFKKDFVLHASSSYPLSLTLSPFPKTGPSVVDRRPDNQWLGVIKSSVIFTLHITTGSRDRQSIVVDSATRQSDLVPCPSVWSRDGPVYVGAPSHCLFTYICIYVLVVHSSRFLQQQKRCPVREMDNVSLHVWPYTTLDLLVKSSIHV